MRTTDKIGAILFIAFLLAMWVFACFADDLERPARVYSSSSLVEDTVIIRWRTKKPPLQPLEWEYIVNEINGEIP